MSPEEDAAFVAGWMAHMNKQPPAVPDVIGLHTEKLKKLWFAGYNGRQYRITSFSFSFFFRASFQKLGRGKRLC